MLRIAVLTLFASTWAQAQPAKTLPGGAVLKPERPVPVVPLKPAPEPSPLPATMQPLAPLVGSFSGTTRSGAKVAAQCLSVAADTWIRCDVSVESSRPSTTPAAQGRLESSRPSTTPAAQGKLESAVPSTTPAAQGRLDKAAALVAIGWDERSKSFHAFVGDSTGKSTLYKGRLQGKKLVFTGPERVTLDLGNPQQPVLATASEVVTLARER
jgi:hypothetical protein